MLLAATGRIMMRLCATDNRLVPFLGPLLPVVVLPDLHLAFMLFMPLLELGHGCCLVEEAQLYTAKQVFQVKNTFER